MMRAICAPCGLVYANSRRNCAGCFVYGGTLEHPEELTDRCCLSALAGLSKYLPLLGAGGIIAFWSDMSTLGFEGHRSLDHVYKEEKKDHRHSSSCGFVEKVEQGASGRSKSAFMVCGGISTYPPGPIRDVWIGPGCPHDHQY